MRNYLGKPLYWSLSIFMIGSVVLFTWGEWSKLSWNNPINSEKFGDFATFISAFATTLTLIFFARQIGEMRKVASHPDLYPAQAIFITEDDHIPHFFVGKDGKALNPSKPYISLHNIGLGAAKEIIVKWVYSEVAVKDVIKGKYEEELFIKEPFDQKYDFIPTSNYTNISLPHNYMFCCGTRCHPGASKPPLQLQILYKDIFDKTFEKEFNVDFECYLNNITVNLRLHKNRQ